ncbi:DUF1116 domain-containing protein [Marinitoga sp. 38H-ov]|uniref:DUF1116 domain-containing protein n=1 Tax=Marinitoga sp. 38H-ov TaxID=1755814 RepID=UPI0013EB8B3B|nr:DUF1116 domain-containing protein [Marinitoga sp. 38H-ov]KAF2956572.1 hypothetical protein AS160_05085 [Marinitoga sp. 38H-ov]
MSLFKEELKIVNIGLKSFYEDLKRQGANVVHVDWKPPLGGSKALKILNDFNMLNIDVEAANKEAVERIMNSQPTLVGMGIARDVVPGMNDNMILHAGPPITWDRMCGPLKGAVIGGLIYEGKAKDEKEAIELIESGEIVFDPWHHHDGVGPMAGVATPSMPVFIIENKTYGIKSYCTMNEGLGKVLRYGANGPDVIEKLKWMEEVLYPVLKEAIELKGEINLKNLIAQAVQMGDECHNRNRAATSLFIREIAPAILDTSFSNKEKKEVIEFINSNDHFFLNLSMPAAKSATLAAEGIKGSTIVTVMARNGTDFGIRLAGLPGQWFVGPAQDVDGLYFPGFTKDDANPDIGDSTITETGGFGGFAMAGAPAIVKFVGGTVQEAIETTLKMYEITDAENNTYKIPFLNFRGTPTGLNVKKVVEKGILPRINTGIAHKEPGIGQVGAGLTYPPINIFIDALDAFVKTYLD